MNDIMDMGNCRIRFVLERMLQYALLALIGLLAGTMIGMIGIGAGVIMVPLMIMVGLTIQQAVGVTLVMQTIPVGILGLYNYYKHGHIQWSYSLAVGLGMLTGIAAGSVASTRNVISDIHLKKGLGIVAIVVGVYMTLGY